MKRLLRRTFDIRPDERPAAALMALSYFLLLSTFYFLKPARDSLFLIKLSPEQLPLVFVVAALASIPVAGLYTRAARRFTLVNLTLGTLVVLVFCLLLLRYLVTLGAGWVYYAFYAWVGIYGILITAQFWLLANAIFDVQQAKRIFALIGAAGILGAFCGGETTGFLVRNAGMATENLIVIAAVILAFATLLIWNLARLLRLTQREQPSTGGEMEGAALPTVELMRLIWRSRLLRSIVALIAIAVISSTFIDFVFKKICYRSYGESEAELTAFLAVFYGRVSLLSLLIQLVIAYPLIRRLGVGGVIMIMPAAILGGAAAVTIAPILIMAIVLKSSEGIFEYSVDRLGRELLFMPLSLELKKRTKIFVDVFVDRLFRGVAGAALILATVALAFGTQWLALSICLLGALWLAIAWTVRREYVDAFRRAILRRDIDLSDLRSGIDDSGTIRTLVGTLSSANDRQVAYSLELLKSAHDPKLLPEIAPLLKHRSPEVRRRAVELLQEYHELIV